MQDIQSIKAKLREHLSAVHYEHSIRTAETAARMARVSDVDEDKAYLAGLLHDYAKGMSGEDLIAEAEKMGIEINSVERAYPYLLHAEVGAELVKKELGVNDEEIINSIAKHTVGSAAMTALDKIIYVADMIEPGRPYQGLDMLRRMALENLDKVYREAYMHSLSYLVKARKLIHPTTIEVWNELVSR